MPVATTDLNKDITKRSIVVSVKCYLHLTKSFRVVALRNVGQEAFKFVQNLDIMSIISRREKVN